ncbi:MAG: class I lanthipeptide [Candidatus Delongbacteria bacterium]
MKKLALNKETIAALNGIQMAGFNGGATLPLTTAPTRCPTTYCVTECDTICWLTNCDTCDTQCYYTCDPTCTTWDSSCC